MSLRFAVKTAWVGDGELRGNLGFVESGFWTRTEQAFFSHVERAVKLVKADAVKALDASEDLRRDWLRVLQTTARRLFDEFAASGNVESGHPERLGKAYRGLMNQLHGRKLHESLGLIKPERAGKRKPDKKEESRPRRAARQNVNRQGEAST
jgi:CRISPR system Cascade subunit CasA